MACYNDKQKASIAEGVRKYYQEHPEAKLKLSSLYKGKGVGNGPYTRTEQSIARLIETRVGGFWYGNVKNASYPKKYCELWTEDLKERIRAYWGYISVISGSYETCVDRRSGIIKAISCHHVYYQPKACCEWDEDEKGYYANINIGTHGNPNIIKHYVGDDPNKFVTLTASEHKSIDRNKLQWIRMFEDIIEDQGGKCYFTKKEINELLDKNQQ